MAEGHHNKVDVEFYCQSSDGQAKAHGRLVDLEVFRVAAGSTAKGHWNWVVQSQLLRSGVLQKSGGVFVFVKDFSFQAPTTAAETVLGRTASGWREWKTRSGEKLGKLAGRPGY